jgi:hypothetical protein
MLFGFVVLMTALTYDPPLKSDRQRDRPARGRRPQRQRIKSQAKHGISQALGAVRESAVKLRTLCEEWWPRLRRRARHTRARWLTLESTTGQVIATAAASLVAAWLIVSTA